jgi:hypothetical protein
LDSLLEAIARKLPLALPATVLEDYLKLKE